MKEIPAIFLSIGLTFILGPALVRLFLDCATSKIDLRPPIGITNFTWRRIISRIGVGEWIGVPERLLVLTSFWISDYTILAAWFAFKVAAKWEVWKNIVQFPIELPNVSPVDYLRARSGVGSYILTRFLLGTLYNVLIGLVAWIVGMHFIEIISYLSRL